MKAKILIDRILDNWPAKIVCLTLSLLLFMFYRMSTLEKRYFSLPLTIQGTGDLVPSVHYPQTIKVSIRGEKDLIYPVQESDIEVYLDLSDITREGDYRIPVKSRFSASFLDADLFEISLEPFEVPLKLEHRVVKKVPVTPSFKGYPEPGYEMTGYVLSPQTIEISGPRTIIDKITEMTTTQIDISGRSAGLDGQVSLLRNSKLVAVSGSASVEYRVTIREATLIRSFEDVPVFFDNLDPAFEIVGEDITGALTLKGGQNDLAGWELPGNALLVSCEHVTSAGVYTLPVQTTIGSPFAVISFEPQDVQLTVRERR
ncbi:MAG: hypothetical protein JW875_00770 [Spirochaetales bacterium]|nr:hypothetical protein [Spirochaetales bacterium]